MKPVFSLAFLVGKLCAYLPRASLFVSLLCCGFSHMEELFMLDSGVSRCCVCVLFIPTRLNLVFVSVLSSDFVEKKRV